MGQVAGVAVVAVGVLAGCGDDRPVTAAAGVTVAPARLPFGSPVEMHFVFERTAEPVALAGPYRVFVHFTDPDGVRLWGDDHDPPVPVDAWRPGEPVAWTRAFFLPRVPYVGPVEVRAGLYDPATGARLRLEADPVGADAYRLATFAVTAQTHPLDFVDGWHQAEPTGGDPPEEWRWSSGTGTLEFINPGEDVTLHLVVERNVELPEPQTVRILLGDQVLDEFELPTGERLWRRVAIPADAFGDAMVQTLSVAADRTFVPAEAGLGADTRELGVSVFHAVLLDQ